MKNDDRSELAKVDLAIALTPQQEAELRAEREAIRRAPRDGASWADVKSRLNAGRD
jgi:hypothetical protein